MKVIKTSETIEIPTDVTISVKAREVSVTGPRGVLKRSFKHLQVDIKKIGNKITVEVWWGTSLQQATVRTVCSHIKNMVVGVTKGYQYNMRLVYAHFPINTSVVEDNTCLEIRNFVGQKVLRRIKMGEGVTITRAEKAKDQLELIGNDLEQVAQSAALITGKTKVREKDIRKFLDGVYVSEKGVIGDLKPVV
eukprot:TRINITY_DN10_c0_g1_i1.p1 TRINITY_DN10_c0_g1~~TRINITY_DN10_c0_g1_i1.p1  ORF type:complete len:192 (+),score=51.84 TRINITY_DN10_c0_g1_i1:47-622(+)